MPIIEKGRLCKGSPKIAKSKQQQHTIIIPVDWQVFLIAPLPVALVLVCAVTSIAWGQR